MILITNSRFTVSDSNLLGFVMEAHDVLSEIQIESYILV
jgi:hypothetical protein